MLLKAVLTLTACITALKVLGFKQTLGLLGRVPLPAMSHHAHHASVATESKAIGRASAAIGMGTCLSKALALCVRLRLQGIDTHIRIGVAKAGSELSAHAWLEHNGAVIDGWTGGSIATSYSAFPALQAGGTAVRCELIHEHESL